MKKIPLTQGKFALVDDGDYGDLSGYTWYAAKNRNTYYAQRSKTISGKPKVIKMHRVIMGLHFGDGKQIDHINGNGLDNQRANLRFCTNQENLRNQKATKNCSSQFKGVNFHKKAMKWQARICVNNKDKHLGSFDTEIEAAKAYNEAAKELFGDYALCNAIGVNLSGTESVKQKGGQ